MADTKPNKQVTFTFVPKTAHGKKLWELRQKVIAAGYAITSEEEFEKVVADYKGKS